MKIYAIYNNADDWRPDVSFYQTVMFHGEAIAPPERRGIASHDVDEADFSPMQLVVNGYRLAEVFLPRGSCNLVVSELAMLRLRPLQSNFTFAPVHFAKVYNLPWPWPGESDIEISPIIDEYQKRGRERSISDVCPHDERMAALLPSYYEVVTPNHYKLLKTFSPTHRFFTMWYETEPSARHLLRVRSLRRT